MNKLISIALFFIISLGAQALDKGYYQLKKSIDIIDLEGNSLLYRTKSVEKYHLRVKKESFGVFQQFDLYKTNDNGKSFNLVAKNVQSSRKILGRQGNVLRSRSLLESLEKLEKISDKESLRLSPPEKECIIRESKELATNTKGYQELLCIMKAYNKKNWISKDSYKNLKLLKGGLNRSIKELSLNSNSSRRHFYSQILYETGLLRILNEKGSSSYFKKKSYGKKWKGRGITQLTGCSNYINFLLSENIYRAGLEKEIIKPNPRKEIIGSAHFKKGEDYMSCSNSKVKRLLKSKIFKIPPYNKIPFDNPDIIKVMTSSSSSLDKLANGQINSIGGLSTQDLNIGGSIQFWKRSILANPKLKKALKSSSITSQERISRAVNGGNNGLAGRKKIFKYTKGCVK